MNQVCLKFKFKQTNTFDICSFNKKKFKFHWIHQKVLKKQQRNIASVSDSCRMTNIFRNEISFIFCFIFL